MKFNTCQECLACLKLESNIEKREHDYVQLSHTKLRPLGMQGYMIEVENHQKNVSLIPYMI